MSTAMTKNQGITSDILQFQQFFCNFCAVALLNCYSSVKPPKLRAGRITIYMTKRKLSFTNRSLSGAGPTDYFTFTSCFTRNLQHTGKQPRNLWMSDQSETGLSDVVSGKRHCSLESCNKTHIHIHSHTFCTINKSTKKTLNFQEV